MNYYYNFKLNYIIYFGTYKIFKCELCNLNQNKLGPCSILPSSL